MGDTGLYLGWRTALLGLVILQILILAVAVGLSPTNRTANALLSSALLVLAGLLTPYAIGFAGAYDVWRGLTFAPFAIPLALGPLLYGYARALGGDRLSRRSLWHLAPAILQAAYFTACFLLPPTLKWDWYTGGHQVFVAPVFDLFTLVSLALYGWAIGGVLNRFRARLADERSDDERFSARWLSRVRAALFVGLTVETGFWLWSALTGGIDYFQQTGLYVALGALGLYLGAAGWRQAGLPQALPQDDAKESAMAGATPDTMRAPPDWTVIAEDYAARLRREGWWREPELTLPRLARRLGVNSGRVSRAINLGLGVNFSAFINDMRAEGVADALRSRPDGDLLDLAFEMGFASKASFNRAFRARYGMAPSQYRRQVSESDSSRPAPDLRRAEA